MQATVTGAQIRAARGVLRWSAADLAKRSDVSFSTVRRAEAQDGVPSTTKANLNALRQSFEAAGIEFIPENETGAGVRWKAAASK